MLCFLSMVKTDDCKGKTLQYYGSIDIDSACSPSMVKAFADIILLAKITSTGFHTSPPSAKAPSGPYFSTSRVAQAQIVRPSWPDPMKSCNLVLVYFRASCSATRLHSKGNAGKRSFCRRQSGCLLQDCRPFSEKRFHRCAQ